MKEEFKQTEGDPAIIKGRTKQVRQVRMRRCMIAAVPNAPVVDALCHCPSATS
ncbi:MAG: EscU/YscU/HrcU family type III secretion system export apparatus switch protein [Hyphomicrobiales bacterium]